MGRMEHLEPCSKRYPYVIDHAPIPEPGGDRRLLADLNSCGHTLGVYPLVGVNASPVVYPWSEGAA